MVFKELPIRKPIRLKGFNYGNPGSYFITICTKDRAELFWLNCKHVGYGFAVPNNISTSHKNIILSESGKIAELLIPKISVKYPDVKIDKYCVMPNHVHLILTVKNGTANPSPTVINAVAWYKFMVTKCCGRMNSENTRIWQRSYHERIIRNEDEYYKIWEYIEYNPRKWNEDTLNLQAKTNFI